MVAYRRLAFAGAVVGLGAVGALIWLVNRYPPFGLAVFAFFLLVLLAAGGLACPLICLLNHRFGSAGGVWDALRQSAWMGLLVALCLWLEAMGVFSWSMAVMLAAVFVLIELFIRRTRAGQ